MAKKICGICGKEVRMATKLQDGSYICSSCKAKIPNMSFEGAMKTGGYTLEEAKQYIDRKEEEPDYNGEYPQYVVLQVALKEGFIGTGSENLVDLELVINRQAAKGYRLHSMSTTTSNSKGIGGGDRIQATLVFEKL
jgi:hypothetical protein